MTIEHEISGSTLITKVPAPTAENPKTLSQAVASALLQPVRRTVRTYEPPADRDARYNLSDAPLNVPAKPGKYSLDGLGNRPVGWSEDLKVSTFRFELDPAAVHNVYDSDPDPFMGFELATGLSCTGAGRYSGADFGSAALSSETPPEGGVRWTLSGIIPPLSGVLPAAPKDFETRLSADASEGATEIRFDNSAKTGSVTVAVGQPASTRKFLYVSAYGHECALAPAGLQDRQVSSGSEEMIQYRNDPDCYEFYQLPDIQLPEGWYDVTGSDMFVWDDGDQRNLETRVKYDSKYDLDFVYYYIKPALAWGEDEIASPRVDDEAIRDLLGVPESADLDSLFGGRLYDQRWWNYFTVSCYPVSSDSSFALELAGNGAAMNFGGHSQGSRRRFFDLSNGEGGRVTEVRVDSLTVTGIASRYVVPATSWDVDRDVPSNGPDADMALDPPVGSGLALTRCSFSSVATGAHFSPRGFMQDSTAKGCLFSGLPRLEAHLLPRSVLGVDLLDQGDLGGGFMRNRLYHGKFPGCSFRNSTFLGVSATVVPNHPVAGLPTLFGKTSTSGEAGSTEDVATLESCLVQCTTPYMSACVLQGAFPPPGWTPGQVTQVVRDGKPETAVVRCVLSPVPALPESLTGLLSDRDYVLRTWPTDAGHLFIDSKGRPYSGSPSGAGGTRPDLEEDIAGNQLVVKAHQTVPLYPRGCWSMALAAGTVSLPIRMFMLGCLTPVTWPEVLASTGDPGYRYASPGETLAFPLGSGALAPEVLARTWPQVTATVGRCPSPGSGYLDDGAVPSVQVTVPARESSPGFDPVSFVDELPVSVTFSGSSQFPDVTVLAGTVVYTDGALPGGVSMEFSGNVQDFMENPGRDVTMKLAGAPSAALLNIAMSCRELEVSCQYRSHTWPDSCDCTEIYPDDDPNATPDYDCTVVYNTTAPDWNFYQYALVSAEAVDDGEVEARFSPPQELFPGFSDHRVPVEFSCDDGPKDAEEIYSGLLGVSFRLVGHDLSCYYGREP